LTNITNPKEALTTYSVKELNRSIGLLLSRGFAPKFILKATVSKAQIKKGHLWLTLTDGKASVDAVAWSSTIKSLKFLPKQDDGVVVVGKLNFWESQARISVQVFDIRPSISTVLKKFEIVKSKLFKEGLIDDSLRRNYQNILIRLVSSQVFLALLWLTCLEQLRKDGLLQIANNPYSQSRS